MLFEVRNTTVPDLSDPRSRIRRAVVTSSPTALRLRLWLNMLSPAAERRLREQLTALESKCMLLRHCGPEFESDRLAADAERVQVANALSAAAAEVAVVFTTPPVRRAPGSVDSADELDPVVADTFARIRADALLVLDAALDAELFVPDAPFRSDDGVPRVRVADDSAATRARIETVLGELHRLAVLNDDVVQRLQRQSRRSPLQAEDGERRRLIANAIIDTVATINAAIAEVEAASNDPMSGLG